MSRVDSSKDDLIDSIDAKVAEGISSLQYKSLAEKSVVVFLGESGVGKSTVVDYLYGCKMSAHIDKDTGTVTIEAENPPATIGDSALSHTLFPQVVDIADKLFSLCDSPGFRDNRGPEYEISGALVLKEILQKVKALKGIVLLISYQSIHSDSRNTGLMKVALHFTEMFPDYAKNLDSFQVFITKVPQGALIDQTIKKLELIQNQIPDEALKGFLKTILSQAGLIRFCDPLNVAERSLILESFNAFKEISDRNNIKLGLSENALLALRSSISLKKESLKQQLQIYNDEFLITYQDALNSRTSVPDLNNLSSGLQTLLELSANLSDQAGLKRFLMTSDARLWPRKEIIFTLVEKLIRLVEYFGEAQSIKIDSAIVNTFSDHEKQLQTAIRTKIIDLSSRDLKSLLTERVLRKELSGSLAQIKQWVSSGAPNIAELRKVIKLSPPNQNRLGELLDIFEQNKEITALKEALNVTLVDPIQVRPDLAKGVVKVTCYNDKALLSDLVNYGKSHLGEKINRLDIVALGNLIIDCDIEEPLFRGKHLVIVSEEISCTEDHFINVSAVAGRSVDAEQAPSGKGQDKDGKGHAGSQGASGFDASTAGSLLIAANTMNGAGKLSLKASGANGGNGQQGGDGAPGGAGIAGEPATIDTPKQDLKLAFTDSTSSVTFKLYEGNPGKNGFAGGDAASGGNAGLGSKAGSIQVLGLASLSKQIILECLDGHHGQAGNPGAPGAAGIPGHGGHRGLEVSSLTTRLAPGGIVAHATVVEQYFGDKWYDGDGNLHDDANGDKFNDIWDQYPKLAEELAQGLGAGKEAAPGLPGPVGGKGEPGKKGEALQVSNLVAANEAMAEYLLYFAVQINSALWKPILSEVTLTVELAFTVLRTLNNSEARALDFDEEEQYLERIIPVYQHLQSVIQSFDQKKSHISQWQFILFGISEKLNFLIERQNGGHLNGNRVVNLEALSKTMDVVLGETEEIKVADKKEAFFKQFSDDIDKQVTGAKEQVSALQERVAHSLDMSSQAIGNILNEIDKLKEHEQEYQKEMLGKKEQLRAEMTSQLALGILSSTLSVAETLVGAAPVISGLTNSIQGLAGSKEATEISIAQLNAKITQDRSMQALKNNYSAEYLLPGIDGVTFDQRKMALNNLNLDSLAGVGGKLKGEYEELRDKEVERVGLNQFIIMSTPRANREGAIARLKVLNKEFAEIAQNEDVRMPYYQSKYSQYTDVRRAEVEELKRQGDMVSDVRKQTQLNNYSQSLDQQEALFKQQRIERYVATGIKVGSTILSGVTTYINTKSNYEDKIQLVDDAIKSSQETATKLDTLTTSTQQYKSDFIENDFKPFLQQGESALKDKSTFQLSVAKLDFKNKLTSVIEDAKKTFSSIPGSEALVSTYNEIEETLLAQIEIWDKITQQFDQKRIGELVYNLSASDSEVAEWSPEQRSYQKSIQVTRLQYLSQVSLSAYRLWSFPAGENALVKRLQPIQATQDVQEAIKIAKDQNNVISRWLAEDRYTWRLSDNMILAQNFYGETAYASVSFLNQSIELHKLLTGESITFRLPTNESYDAVKFLTLYAYAPQLSEYSYLNMTIDLDGPALFSISTDSKRKQFAFAQDKMTITHSMDIHFDQNQGINAIWASVEDRGLQKFKANKMDSGRSPFATVTLQLNSNKLKASFWDFLQDTALMKEYFELFPEFFGKEILEIDAKKTATMQNIMETLFELQWIGGEKPSYHISEKLRWTSVESSRDFLTRGYSAEQSAWIKQMIYQQLKLVSVQAPEPFKIDFVGYGFFLNRAAYKKVIPIPDAAYKKFEI